MVAGALRERASLRQALERETYIVAGDEPAPRPSQRRRSSGLACVVNGRFFGQTVTGVQRYGREIVAALDPLLAAHDAKAEVALPRGAVLPAGSDAITAVPKRGASGHLWEQARLPLGLTAPLLNLCNTGPIAVRRQVVCIHDANVLIEPGSYRFAFRLLYRTLQPLLARRAAVLTTVSHASAKDLADILGVDRHRIVVLPNGHEHALRWTADPDVYSRWPSARPFVLVLGSRARHKNIDLLLRLAPALDGIGLDLVVAGGGGGIFTAESLSGAGSTNVFRLGPVSDNALAALMQRALCLAFPSWTEGFGLPIVEAMAHGCPVIASDRASMPEVCGSAALMAPPDDPDAWLRAIAALQRSPTMQSDLAGRGREQVRRFSWSESARGYLDLLAQIA